MEDRLGAGLLERLCGPSGNKAIVQHSKYFL